MTYLELYFEAFGHLPDFSHASAVFHAMLSDALEGDND